VKKETSQPENGSGVRYLAKAKRELLQALARENVTPILVIDHEKIRANYREFREDMPEVQVYFAVKANSNPEIVKTLYEMGCSFDVASMPEFMIVYENIMSMPKKEWQDWIWDNIIYVNTIKPIETFPRRKPVHQFRELRGRAPPSHRISSRRPRQGQERRSAFSTSAAGSR